MHFFSLQFYIFSCDLQSKEKKLLFKPPPQKKEDMRIHLFKMIVIKLKLNFIHIAPFLPDSLGLKLNHRPCTHTFTHLCSQPQTCVFLFLFLF